MDACTPTKPFDGMAFLFALCDCVRSCLPSCSLSLCLCPSLPPPPSLVSLSLSLSLRVPFQYRREDRPPSLSLTCLPLPMLVCRGRPAPHCPFPPRPPLAQTLLVTADHSPESVREFERMRLTHPANRQVSASGGAAAGSGGQHQLGSAFSLPSLLVVYDSPSSNKLKCSPVFDVDVKGVPRVTNKGR